MPASTHPQCGKCLTQIQAHSQVKFRMKSRFWMLRVTMSNSTWLHNTCLCHLASLSILTKSEAWASPLVGAGRSAWRAGNAVHKTSAGLVGGCRA